jgi:hypothetical protein
MLSNPLVLGVIGGIVGWLVVRWRARRRSLEPRHLSSHAPAVVARAGWEKSVKLTEEERGMFGPVAECTSLQAVFAFIRGLPAVDAASRHKGVAYAMVLVASEHVCEGSNFYQGRDAIDSLSRAKCEFDLAFHDYRMALVSSSLLLEAQRTFEEAMVPCTEWASTEDIWRAVLNAATRSLAPPPSGRPTDPTSSVHAHS